MIDNANARVERRILDGLGMPLGTSHTVQFDRSDIDTLLSLLFATSVFGWAVVTDLYVVPDHAHMFLTVSHHDEVFATFQTDDALDPFAEGMTSRGFPLED